ncbi:MAG TPA: YkgJ family cysteine cluster protein [Lachnospiraceae bacterium]|nr:YkgJ family cysteine cluster protein [Lachnospiraceae bacterium]
MRLYDVNDMVKADCQGCEGCSECCLGMGDSIVLDPLDVFHLMQYLQMSFEELLKEGIALHLEDGLILPHVRMVGPENRCYFLSEEGRCTIHTHRPGLCRAFPLGRQYTDGKLTYFLLEEACAKKQHTKVKVSKWVSMQDMPNYRDYLEIWHAFLKEQRNRVHGIKENEQMIKRLNMSLLRTFYMLPYEQDTNFMVQFEGRMKNYDQYSFDKS